jgi:hypothetical protein
MRSPVRASILPDRGAGDRLRRPGGREVTRVPTAKVVGTRPKGPFWLCSLVVTVVLTSLTSNSFSNWTDCDYEDQMVPATSSSSQQCLVS